MKVDASLQEVWGWKNKVYEETKDLSMRETVENIRQGAGEFCKKFGLKLKVLDPAGRKPK